MSAERDEHGRFVKGQSGNPGGGRGPGLKAAILRELDANDESGRRKIDLLAEKLVGLCLEGDTRALKLVLDRGWPASLELHHQGLPRVRRRDFTGGGPELLGLTPPQPAQPPAEPVPVAPSYGPEVNAETTAEAAPETSPDTAPEPPQASLPRVKRLGVGRRPTQAISRHRPLGGE